MSARILLVTGSRVLASSMHEERAKALLAAYCEAYAPTLIVTGDADGPDDWAASWAIEHAIDLRIYALDGWVHTAGQLRRPWSKAPRAPGTFCDPLDRNAAMVRDVARQARRGATVQVVAIEADWSSTKGTAHTVGVARDCALPITHVRFELGRS